jgi:hemerythrin
VALFEWSDIYSVGNENIDKQHKQLFDIANRFAQAYAEGHGKDILASIFAELLEYTQYHFADEERLMKEAGFPDFYQHKANHEKLIEVVLNLKKNFDDHQEGIEERIMDFLKMWLNGHILGMDRNYKSYLKDDQAA